MKELNAMPIVFPEEENNNEAGNYNYLNSTDTPNIKENKENNDFSNIIIVKDSNYYKNCIKSHYKSFIAFTFIYFFYIISLEGCYEGEDQCSLKISWIYHKIIEELVSCIILVIVVQLMLFKIISKRHLIHLIIIFPLFYIYSHGLDFPDHGYYNFFYYFVVFTIFTIIIQPFSIIIYCIKKKNVNKIVLLIYLVIVFIFFSFIYIIFIYIPSNCNDWGKGLNNTYIENDIEKYGCQIKNPKKCGYEILKKYQDYTKLKNKDCKTYKVSNPRMKILKLSSSPYINNDAKRIGFPLTNKDPICFEDFGDECNKIYKFVFQNLVDMDKDAILNKYFKEKKPEIEIDFTDNEQGNMIINVEYNQTLSSERKLLEKNADPYSDNILIIYNFLNNLFEDNLLKDTSVLLLSDHGVGMPSVYFTYDFYTIEIHLPMLYIITNDRKNNNYEEQYKYLNENQQTLITGFDIYNTIGHLAFGDKYFSIDNKTDFLDTPKAKYGKSLFEKINSKERKPEIYKNLGSHDELVLGVCK